jgi:hypothetical protein
MTNGEWAMLVSLGWRHQKWYAMYVKAKKKYMYATLYNVGEDRNASEIEKHAGVAANVGHGVLAAMI